MADIQNAASQLNLLVRWKEKRNLINQENDGLEKPYASAVKKMVKLNKMQSINPEMSGYWLAQQSAIVISMPFTSTAILAGHLGKPSCFYDPTGLIQKNDRAARGIPIVSGNQELKSWLNQAKQTIIKKNVSEGAQAKYNNRTKPV